MHVWPIPQQPPPAVLAGSVRAHVRTSLPVRVCPLVRSICVLAWDTTQLEATRVLYGWKGGPIKFTGGAPCPVQYKRFGVLCGALLLLLVIFISASVYRISVLASHCYQSATCLIRNRECLISSYMASQWSNPAFSLNWFHYNPAEWFVQVETACSWNFACDSRNRNNYKDVLKAWVLCMYYSIVDAACYEYHPKWMSGTLPVGTFGNWFKLICNDIFSNK